MKNREYGYEELQQKVYDDVRGAIAEAGQEAVRDGIKDILNVKIKNKELNLSNFGRGLGKEGKKISEYVSRALQDAVDNKPLVVKPKISIEPQLSDMNERELLDEIQNLYDKSAEAFDDREIQQSAKELIYAIKLAQSKNYEVPKQMSDLLKDFVNPKDPYYGQFADKLKDFSEQINQDIISKNVNDAIKEYIKNTNEIYKGFTQIDDQRTEMTSDIGLTEAELLDKINKENEALKENKELFRERISLIKEGKVVASYLGSENSVATPKDVSKIQADKIIHTHSPWLSGAPSFPDIYKLATTYAKTGAKSYKFKHGNNEIEYIFDNLVQEQLELFAAQYQENYYGVQGALGKKTKSGKVALPPQSKDQAYQYINALAKENLENLGGKVLSSFDIQPIEDAMKIIILNLGENIVDELNSLGRDVQPGDMSNIVIQIQKQFQESLKQTMVQPQAQTKDYNIQNQAYEELIKNNTDEINKVKEQTVQTDEEDLEILKQISDIQSKLYQPKHVVVEDINSAQQELRENVEKTNEVLDKQRKKIKESQSVQKTTESLDEFQQKIQGIKEFSEEYDLFDFKDFDEETLDKLQNTLFALTSEDLKKLGFENTDAILEDLATINERLAEVRWQFENNDFTDEGWVQSDQLDDYIDTGLSRVSIFHDIDEVADEARMSVSRLINTIVDFDDRQSTGQIIDVKPEELQQVEKATELIDKQTEAVEELNRQEEAETETRINLLDVLAEVNRETANQPESSMPEMVKEEEKAVVKEKELQEQTEQTTQAIEEQTVATDRAFNSFGELRHRIDELKEEQARLEKENSNLTDVYKRYQKKQKEYGLLSDEELESKWQEKLEHKTDYKSQPGSDDFYKKWSSILALVDEIQKRTGETKDLNLLSTSGVMNEVDVFAKKIQDYAQNADKYDQITNQILEISREWKALEMAGTSYNSPLDQLEKKLYENIDYIIGAKRIKTERKDTILSELSQIGKIKGSPVSIEDYTKEEKVLTAINNRYQELQKQREELAKTKPEFTNDEERKAFAKQEAERLAAQRENKKSADIAVEAQQEIQTAIKETAQVQDQANQQQQSSANDNINSYRNLIKTMREFVDAVTSQRQITQQASTEEVTQSNKDLANASEQTAATLSLESQSAIDAANSLTQLSTAKQVNTEQEEKLAQKTLEAASALIIEGDAAKDTAKNLKALSEVKSSVKESKKNKKKNIIDSNSTVVSVGSEKQGDQVSKIDKITEAYKELAKTQKEFAILDNKKQNGKSFTNKEAGRYQELITIREKYNKIIQEQTAYTLKQMEAYQKYNDVLKETDSYIKGINENDTFVSKTQGRIDKLFNSKTDKTDDFYERLQEIQNRLNNIVTPEAQSNLDNYKQSINELIKDLEQNGNQFKLVTDLQKAKLDNQMADWLEKNTRASTETRNSVKQLRLELESIQDVDSLKRITADFIKLKSATSDAQKTGASFFDKVINRIKDVNVKFLAQYFSIQDWIRYIRQMAQTVVELDTAITELRKVSDATDERLALSFEKSAETAKELGDSITNVINVTADWSRLGYSVDDAEELARVTTLFKNVGDNMSADDASSYLISTLQGFQLTAEKAESIVDKFNEVANNYAIDTRGIGEALQRSAASFNAANTSLSGAIAVVTTANSVVQNPEQVGTAMKTLSARIRGSKVELEELGEEEENVTELTSKLRNEVKAMTGFDIMENEDTYKSIDEIIIGIGEHWKELTDIQQAALAEDLAGKRNSNVLIALLQNAELVKKVYETAEDATGSAQQEQENYMKSIQYSLDKLKATWQEIQSELLKSSSLKSIVESAAKALSGLGKAAEGLSKPLSLLMEVLGGIFKLLGNISEATNGIGLIGIAGAIYAYKKYTSAKIAHTIATEASAKANKDEAKSEIADAVAKKANKEATDKETASVWKLVAAKAAQAKASLVAGGPAMWAALAASIALVTVAVIAVVKKYYEWYNSAEQVIKRSEKLREEVKKTSDALKEQAQSAKEAEKQLKDLADSYKDAVEGSDEFYELSNKIAELEPSLVIGYTSNGDAIIADTNAIYDQIDAYRQLKEEKIAEARESARTLINTNIQEYDKTVENKNNIDEEIAKKENQILEQQKRIEKLKSNLEKQYGENWQLSEGAADFGQEYDSAIKNLSQYEAELSSLQEESKQYGQYLKELNSEFGQTYQYLFDDFDETLSDKDKEFEKNLRQFVIGVAKETKLSPEDFDQLYNSAKGVNKELFKQLFELDPSKLSYEDYTKQANNIYAKIIDALEQDSDFELTDDHKLGIKIVLGIDNTSIKNQKNQRNKFVKSIGLKNGKNQAKDWYDQRTSEELKLINENIDKFKSLKYIDTEHLVDNLDDVLKKLKQINEEVNDLEFSMSSFEEKENDIESLQSLYNQFVENVEDGKINVPLDISDVEGLREKWESIVGKEAFDKFELTVTTEGFEDAYQKAFDDMLSKYLSAQISMRGATAETAKMMKSQLTLDGLTDESAETFVNAKMAEAKAYEFTSKAKQNDNVLTKESVESYIAECEQLGITTDLMGDYLTEAMLIDGVTLSVDDEGLEELASKLNVDINLLKELKGLLDPINSGKWNGNLAGVPTELRKDLLKRQQENKKNKNDEKYEKGVFDAEKAKKEAKDAGKEAADEYVEAFEKELKELDDLRDSGIINEKDYLNHLQALYIKYFANRKEYIKEFKKYEKQYLEGMQALYEKAISAAITLLNDQKDDLEKAKDDAIDALEDAKDAEIDPINDHIKALENEKDSLEKEREAMQKANDEREREINLQKAQYELERANSQRTRLIKINVRSYSNIA